MVKIVLNKIQPSVASGAYLLQIEKRRKDCKQSDEN
jgi:hypothetical protein